MSGRSAPGRRLTSEAQNAPPLLGISTNSPWLKPSGKPSPASASWQSRKRQAAAAGVLAHATYGNLSVPREESRPCLAARMRTSSPKA
eukprot:9473132-Pyramimonas_sp.AAC.1